MAGYHHRGLRGNKRDYLHPGQIHVEWQLRELRGRFYRLPPKDDSYRSPAWEPCVPVDLPPFLAELLVRQVKDHPYDTCPCQPVHGGTGRYVFRSPDRAHYRRSNYGRRVFRPACDGRIDASGSSPGRLVIADATTWPGIPRAFHKPAQPGATYTTPQGRGIQRIPEDTPTACWLPIKPGLTTHGLRHGHKTWMAEDGIPEILKRAAPRPRGPRYARPLRPRLRPHASATRSGAPDALGRALEERKAIHPSSPVPLLNELLNKKAPTATVHALTTRGDTASQIPPKKGAGPIRDVG